MRYKAASRSQPLSAHCDPRVSTKRSPAPRPMTVETTPYQPTRVSCTPLANRSAATSVAPSAHESKATSRSASPTPNVQTESTASTVTGKVFPRVRLYVREAGRLNKFLDVTVRLRCFTEVSQAITERFRRPPFSIASILKMPTTKIRTDADVQKLLSRDCELEVTFVKTAPANEEMKAGTPKRSFNQFIEDMQSALPQSPKRKRTESFAANATPAESAPSSVKRPSTRGKRPSKRQKMEKTPARTPGSAIGSTRKQLYKTPKSAQPRKLRTRTPSYMTPTSSWKTKEGAQQQMRKEPEAPGGVGYPMYTAPDISPDMVTPGMRVRIKTVLDDGTLKKTPVRTPSIDPNNCSFLRPTAASRSKTFSEDQFAAEEEEIIEERYSYMEHLKEGVPGPGAYETNPKLFKFVGHGPSPTIPPVRYRRSRNPSPTKSPAGSVNRVTAADILGKDAAANTSTKHKAVPGVVWKEKNEREEYIDNVSPRESPGPGAYSPTSQATQAIGATKPYTVSPPSHHELDAARRLRIERRDSYVKGSAGQDSPGPGVYNPRYDSVGGRGTPRAVISPIPKFRRRSPATAPKSMSPIV